MHITCDRTSLLIALKRTGAAINPAYSPTRASVLFHVAASDDIRMGATDGTIGVSLRLSGSSVRQAGRAMLPHKRLTSLVTELPEGTLIEISVDDKFHATIKSATSKRKFTMSGYDPSDFPNVLAVAMQESEALFALDAKSLISASADVKPSIDQSRVDGALLMPDGKAKFHMVALCNASMSIATGELIEAETQSLESVTLPRLLIESLSVFGGDKTSIVRVQRNAQHIRLESDGCVIFCAMLYQEFPGWWRDAIEAAPKERRFRVSAERFLESVRAVSVAADLEGVAERFVQIDVTYKDGECLVSTRKSQRNYGEDELPVTGTELSMGDARACVMHLDGQRLSAALRAATPGEVDVFYDVVGSQESFFLRGDAFQAMVMPVRVIEPPLASAKK